MKSLLLALAALAPGVLAPSAFAEVGETPPEIEAVKWYNTPPLALKSLQGKAVLVEVFRTW